MTLPNAYTKDGFCFLKLVETGKSLEKDRGFTVDNAGNIPTKILILREDIGLRYILTA